MKKRMRAFAVLGGFMTCGAFAAETDNFTPRERADVADATEILNTEINRRLQKSVDKANKSLPIGCDVPEFYKEFRSQVHLNPAGWLEIWIETRRREDRYGNPKFPKSAVKMSVSIYRRIPFKNSAMFRAAGHIADSLLVGDLYIGSDKISHFFSQGLEYYEENEKSYVTSMRDGGLTQAEMDKKASDTMFDYGHKLEEGVYGLKASGVYSFGDLNANYDGYRFWNQLTYGQNAHVRCVDNQLKLARPFDLRDYVHAGWDETINCNMYSDKVGGYIHDEMKARGITCPMAPNTCDRLAHLDDMRLVTHVCRERVTELRKQMEAQPVER